MKYIQIKVDNNLKVLKNKTLQNFSILWQFYGEVTRSKLNQ